MDLLPMPAHPYPSPAPARRLLAGLGTRRRGSAGAAQIGRPLRWILPILVFSAFMSGVSLLPSRTNVGPFEIVAVVLVAYFLLNRDAGQRVQLDSISRLLLLIALLAIVSQLGIRPENRVSGLIQTAIMVNLFVVVTILGNLVRRYRIQPIQLLTLVTYSALIAGIWVIYSGLLAGGDIQASGPFRNRAHTAAYMLTAFWMILIFLRLPGVRRIHQWAGLAAAATCLYAIAISGRRSVYLALFVGLIYLSFAFLLARRGKRVRTLVIAVFAVGFVLVLYNYGERLGPQGSFFQERVGLVGDRLRAFVSPEEDDQEGFFALQRQGIKHAVSERPILGIGWGGFASSIYSPTGHEVHSTPLRFLAELGLVGFALYVTFIAYLLVHSIRLFLRMRHSAYSGSYLTLAVATWSLSVSYIYNRHITERTFWLFLVVFIAFDVLAGIVETLSARRAAARRQSQAVEDDPSTPAPLPVPRGPRRLSRAR